MGNGDIIWEHTTLILEGLEGVGVSNNAGDDN